MISRRAWSRLCEPDARIPPPFRPERLALGGSRRLGGVLVQANPPLPNLPQARRTKVRIFISRFVSTFQLFASQSPFSFFRPSLCISSLGHAVSDYGDDEARLFMTGFFQELQRRKVYRVAAAYIIAAGFIIQIGSAVFPAWALPNWTFRLVVVLLLMGFPIA